MALISRTPFGAAPTGEPVEQITLDNDVLSCQIITFGAALRSLMVPDRDGRMVDVVLGYDSLEEYISRDGYLGAVVGRFANRIAKGRFTLNGTEYILPVNDGPNHLHGGITGFSHRVWTVRHLTAGEAVLTLDSPDGEEGYPGNLTATVTYRLEGSALSIRYQAQSDRDTICNLTNHSYFNLSGHDSGPALEQELTIHAHRYTPTGPDSIPLGQAAPVEGTPMDLRRPTPLGAHIDEPFRQLIQGKGYDHNYVIDGLPGVLHPAARAHAAGTGITMAVDTTLPGIQLYTANFIPEGTGGKGGAVYGPRHAFCLETQFFPDSPNQPAFPSPILRAGQVYDHTTRFTFQAD